MTVKAKKYYKSKRKGTQVQWGLFENKPNLIFEGDENVNGGKAIEISRITEILSLTHEAAIHGIKHAEKGSVKLVQKIAIDAIFHHYGKIVSGLPDTEELGLNTYQIFSFIDVLVNMTALGAHDEGMDFVWDFLMESLGTDDLNAKFKSLIETQQKMRGKKLTKERAEIYYALKKIWDDSQATQKPFNLRYELENTLKKQGKTYSAKEKKRIVVNFYPWRIR